MDLAIDVLDSLVFDSLYAKYYPLPRHSLLRQIITLNVTQTIGGYFFYFFFASLSYYFIYDRSQMAHPKFLKNQIRKEIMVACKSIPIMSVIMTGPALVEVRGYSRAYRNVDEYGWGYFFLSIVLFLLFTDMCIYWIHRALHHPLLYTRIHKPHHLWKVPTPFASHAFHPLDGTSQAIPYHIFIWFFPMHAGLFLAMFIFVNCWTIMIHDGAYFLDSKIVNTTAHHTVHHLEFNYNYGQYFTIW
ncbi:putative C-5 sterol desaturase, partial [Paraphysoderma sedebokerense]